ncbi:hypothetical protein POTOM_000258 [Populus tomentosa]|uniref:GPI mannosyltransferase 1 n=1 Tax=Populus tomentosa TaxID=118781 RepID=A0A8X8AMQ5_POPTO|nr:hypothetical protein POTOM_000258 [Populus tomentosa]
MKWLKIRTLLLLSAIFRVILIVYGEWQDTHMEVRYTDVDYLVFSDAASLMANGESPYKRTTYRYSPLLAFLLTPNSFIHRSWGKFIFSAADLFVGSFIQYILKKREVPEDMCLYSVMVWLLNPFTFTIGTRNIVQAAFWYGLVVHFRIYPIIYALPIVLVLDPHSFQSGQKPCLVNWKSSQDNASHGRKEVSEVYGVLTALKTIFTRGRIMFAMVSGSVFMLLVEKLISFLPQLIVQLVLIIRFAQDLPFCLFLQTVAFVAFNKLSVYVFVCLHSPLCGVNQVSGNYRTVLCMVFLLVASNTAMEQNEAEVGRLKLCTSMDGSSDPLVVVGLFT